FGVILMMASVPMVATFAAPPPGWGIDPLADQQWAGALAWSYGEPIALAVVVLFASRWYRHERRTAAVRERHGAVQAEQDLADYNTYLRSLPR
ncbi:cytochrome c oxidase assembly protein, partial [Rhodococcus zopfii]